MTVRLTMLNSMAHPDFIPALNRHVKRRLKDLDLKNAIFGKKLIDLTNDEAKMAAGAIKQRGLSTHCLSSELFFSHIEDGEAAFREQHLAKIDRLAELAKIFSPRYVRLLAARTQRREELSDVADYINQEYPWLIPMYGQAIDKIFAAGFQTTIENEIGGCIFSKPEEINAFFQQLGRREKVCFTWDVQNLWQQGTFPSVEVFEKLKPLIGYFHLKGGRGETESGPLVWASGLPEASWPVAEITRAVIDSGVSQVICLNPSHGQKSENYDKDKALEKSIAFLRDTFPEIE